MKSASDRPKDLDYRAKKKWDELVGCVDVDADLEMLANYCRQHSSLLALRRERWQLHRKGNFQSMVKGRDGTQTLNPMLVAENRLIASLNRMLKGLGLTPTRDDGKKRKPLSEPRPAWANPDCPEPSCGWALESALCGYDYPSGKMNESNPDHPNFKLGAAAQ